MSSLDSQEMMEQSLPTVIQVKLTELIWFKVAQNSFPAISKTYILMCHYNHSLSIDATIMVSKNCPITVEHVGIIFVT